MKDTPRTDEEEHRLKKLYDASSDLEWPSFNAVADFTLCRQIERELNAAQALIRQQQLLDEENQRLKERVKRLEEAGDLCLDFSFRGMRVFAEKQWRQAKEAKP